MKTYWPNSKKFLILSSCFWSLSFSASFAALPNFESEITSWGKRSFEPLIEKWEKNHGPQAAEKLAEIAKNKKLGDRERYIALMGAAKLGGTNGIKFWSSLIKDSSWVMRSAVLRALRLDSSTESGKIALQSLKDKALVVRLEAIDTVSKLKPTGWEKAVLETLNDPRNFHNQEPLWVPARALKALKQTTEPKTTAAELAEVIKTMKSQSLKASAQDTLQALKI